MDTHILRGASMARWSLLPSPAGGSVNRRAAGGSAALEAAGTLTAAELQDVEQALREAKAHGIGSLTDAVAWLVQHPPATISLQAAVAEFNLAKRCEGIREPTLRGYRYRLGAFAGTEGERQLAAIAPAEIADHVMRCSNATTRANSWQSLATFFTWAVRQGYTDHNPVFLAMRKPFRPRGGRCIFTPLETTEILHQTKHTSAIGYWVLALFAGLRTQEIRWLHDHRDPWSLIRPGTDVIDLRDQPPKANPRVVPILPVLRPWLKWMQRHDVPFLPLDHWKLRRQLKCAVLAARFGSIARTHADEKFRFYNMARRSYISYRLVLPEASYAKVANDVGNSELILRKFYVLRTSRADAERYFALTPSRV